jgi:4-hydroxybutyrate dehydrogenase
MPGPSIFTFPNRVLFGEGAAVELAAELARLGVRKPLVITDAGLVAAGVVARVIAPIGKVPVFDAVQPNPTEADVLAGLDRYHEDGCDGLLGLGGGSPIDCAKAVRLLVTHPGRLVDYDFMTGGLDRITPDLPPMIAVPTTAGTGSEAGRGTLIQLPQNGRKTIALSPFLLPNAAICDPVLVLGLPAALTAGTGMDAISHCLESYLSTTFHPICDGIALEGLRHLCRGLEPSVADGSNLSARRECLMGSLMGGISFHKGLGVVHALSHALGSEGRAHHGTINAILLPHALRLNREAAEPRMVELGASLGLGRSGDAAGHLIALMELLLARLPLPKRLGEVGGLSRDRIPGYARLASMDHCLRTNPRPCSLPDLEGVLQRAW